MERINKLIIDQVQSERTHQRACKIAGNQMKIQQTMLISKSLPAPLTKKTANGGKIKAMIMLMILAPSTIVYNDVKRLKVNEYKVNNFDVQNYLVTSRILVTLWVCFGGVFSHLASGCCVCN